MPALTAPAHGKINLALYVLGKRPDGFHDIATILQAVDTCDLLHFDTSAERLEITCDNPDLPCDESNLIARAVRCLEAETGRSLPVRVRLEKVLPVGAGMGGGSTDAATTLWALNRLYNLKLEVGTLRGVGARIGSDVPFFLTSGQALAEGRGERIIELEFPTHYSVLLAFPGVFISAAEAYRRAKISLTNPLSDCKIHRRLAPEKFWGWVGSQNNDLAAGITAAYPVVARGIEAMSSLGARFAGMTGSGSAVFGLFEGALTPRAWQRWPDPERWTIWPARPLRTTGSLLPAAGWVPSGG